MSILTTAEVEAALKAAPGWTLDNGALQRGWALSSFADAIAFVNQVAAIAEDMGHHPDIDIRYNKVRLVLISHDVSGITKRDTSLAERLSRESDRK